MRTPAALAATALVASTLVAGLVGSQTAANAASEGLSWCNPVVNPEDVPCITAASRGEQPLFPGSPEYAVTGTFTTPEPGADDRSRYLNVVILRNDDTDLGADNLDERFSVTVNLGDQIVPRVATGKARGVTVTRTDNGDGTYAITVEGKPVRLDGQCDQSVYPWVCPEDGKGTADQSQEWDAIWSADITDYASWEDAAQRDAMYGMNYFNNIAATSVPPEIVDDHLLIRMANRHFREDGTTPVQGRAELRIPNAFLKEVYGIPDPSTMDGSSLVASGTATGPGTVDIKQESGKDAMKVLVDGITFSMRNLKVKTGTITPTRPTQVSAMRLGERRGHLDSDPSNPRGATVTGYVGRCVAVSGDHVVTAVGEDTIVRVTGLRAGAAYDCRMRATSSAGPSRWSDTARMGRRVVDPS